MAYLEYLTKLPAFLPMDGSVLVHNSVMPTRHLSEHGFRAWLQTPNVQLESCHCSWARELGPHFRERLDASSSTRLAAKSTPSARTEPQR
jgi:hypothetical protein